MTDAVRVFVDEQPRTVPAGITVTEAVAGDDPGLARAVREGRAYVTDGVGRPIEPTGTVFPGAIYRVVRSARRGEP